MPGEEMLLQAAGGGGNIVSSGIQMGLGAVQTAVGLINSKKAKKEAKRLAGLRPKFKESPYFKDALSMAQSELSTGMSGEAKTAYEQGLDRDLSNSLSAILQGGGSVNNVSELFDQSAQGRQRLSLMKENLRLNQINNLVRAQTLSEEQREKAFQFNEWAPWADKAQANAQARQSAQNMIWGGINTFGSGLMSMAGAKSGQNQLQNFFNNPTTTSDGQEITMNPLDSTRNPVNAPQPNSPADTLAPAFINPNYLGF